MLAQGQAEAVAAVALENEVEVFLRRGIEGGVDGRLARIGDGTGRQAGVYVRVVGRGELEVAEEKTPGILVFDLEGVDDGRVAVELHPDPQAVMEDG